MSRRKIEDNVLQTEAKTSSGANATREDVLEITDELGELDLEAGNRSPDPEIYLSAKWQEIHASIDRIKAHLRKALDIATPLADSDGTVEQETKPEPIARRLFAPSPDSYSPATSSVSPSPETHQIPKATIYEFLERTLHIKLSKHFLTDVTISTSGTDNELIVVGRPQIDGTSKQHRHVIPFSFITKLIESAVQKATTPKELLNLLKDKIKVFIYNQKGFAIKSSDLATPDYVEIAARMEESDAADRCLTFKSPGTPDAETVLLASPGKADRLFTTPTKKDKAAAEYGSYNLSYVEAALSKLSDAILDPNTATIATQALSRFIFILFNKSPYTCFAEEGHSQNFEIRLYESETAAANPSKNLCRVLTPIELAHHLATISGTDYSTITPEELISVNHWHLDKCIRIVNCEGNKIRLIPDALKILNDIVIHYNLLEQYDARLIAEYNDEKNFELKLLNHIGEPLIYNANLVNNELIQNNIAAQIAKLLYLAFDLKAPEKLVYYPVMDTGIVTYTSATGKKKVNYTFKDGNRVREFQKAQSSLDEKFLRDDVVDQEILALKLVEMFFIGTSPFAGFTTGFHASSTNLLIDTLEHIIRIAAIDYEMPIEQEAEFHDEVIALFSQLQTTTIPLEHADSVDISVMGSDGMHDVGTLLYQ